MAKEDIEQGEAFCRSYQGEYEVNEHRSNSQIGDLVPQLRRVAFTQSDWHGFVLLLKPTRTVILGFFFYFQNKNIFVFTHSLYHY